GTITKLAIVVGIAVSGYSPRRSGCMLLTHPFLLQVFGVEADAKNLPQNRNISLQSRSPDYPFLYYLCTG
ncbi:hypothetical protein RBH58_26640, partial [Escherichia coli]|uniref:hypothetical protein n=3 Tax=Escherichia coli TaxID=562 RepID=UPI002FCC4A2B